MNPLESILVTTDFSDAANQALQRAALIATQHQARLTLLHVVDPSALKGPRTWFSSAAGIDHKVAVAQAALGRLAARLAGRHDLHVTQVVQVGRPLEHICRMTDEADLLVFGTKRVNPLRNLLLGTPTEQLLRLVRRPVLVAKRAAQDNYQCVLVAVNLDADPMAMLRSAGALAPAASLHALHALSTRRMDRMRASNVPERVIQEVGGSERLRGMAKLRAMLRSTGLGDAQAAVDHGDPSRLTLDKQQQLSADLIVLGKDGQSALCNFLLGSVAQRILASAPCDILIMPKVAALRGSVKLPASGTWLDSSPARVFDPVDALAPAVPKWAKAPAGLRASAQSKPETRTDADAQPA